MSQKVVHTGCDIDGGWWCVYVNGKLYHEGHDNLPLVAKDLLEELGVQVRSIGVDIPHSVFDEFCGCFPETLEELVAELDKQGINHSVKTYTGTKE